MSSVFSSALTRYFMACMLAATTGAEAGSVFETANGRASAKIDFRVVIPETLRLLADDHPARLSKGDARNAPAPALQRIVMLSTLRKGFCLNLRLGSREVAHWKLQLPGSPDARMDATAEGYRLCVLHAGRHELALSHSFVMGGQRAGPDPVDWPVYLSLAAP
jgi:hypothetical protein